VDAEALQAGLDPGPHPAGCPVTDDPGRIRAVGGPLGPDVVRDGSRELFDIRAVVALLGHALAAPQRDHRRPELVDLSARVVEVVLARHALAASLEDPAQQVADERPACVADRERPGRVGRDKLHVHGSRSDRRDTAPVRRRRQDAVDRLFEDAIGQADVDEPGRGHDRRCDRAAWPGRRGGQRVYDRLGDGQRGSAQRPGQLHREVRGQVAMLGLGRPLDLDRRGRLVGGYVGQVAG
jgi:hypothetical protein